MKKSNVSWANAILFGCAMVIVSACSKSSEPMGKGDAEFQITDAPSDDASIKSVFVTVADIKVDGQSISGFTKQTIDIKAYQGGNTKLLGTAQLSAKAYTNLTLVLDADADATGATPGCYVLTTDNSKYKLRSSGTIAVVINEAWNVSANSKSTSVVDLDLRKAIRAMSDQTVRYNFVSNDNLQASLRLVTKEKSGSISGSYSEQTSSNADKIIAYVYKKGSFDATVETQAQGDDAIFFKNAVGSAEVSGSLTRTFAVAFLDAGDYEVHYAAYKKDTVSDRFNFQTMLKSQTTVNGSVGDFVTVAGGITISISSLITGTI